MRALALLLAALLSLATSAAAAPPNAAMLANACNGCHGVRGVSAGLTVPTLAGQWREYFVQAMKDFRSGARPSTVMGTLARGYSDAQIEAMAGYYAAQKVAHQGMAVDAALAEKGRQIYYKRCRSCHLDNGKLWGLMHQRGEYNRECRSCHADSGPDAKNGIPYVAGQWRGYLEMQIAEFREGKRRMPDEKAEKMKGLNAQDVEALAHFCAGQAVE